MKDQNMQVFRWRFSRSGCGRETEPAKGEAPLAPHFLKRRNQGP